MFPPDFIAKEKSNLFMILLLPSIFFTTAFVVAKYAILGRLNTLDNRKKSLFVGLPLLIIVLCSISVGVFFAYGLLNQKNSCGAMLIILALGKSY